jgi:hypothetical protein
VTTPEIIIYTVVAMVGLGIFFGTKFLARKFGAGNQDAASAAFDEIGEFEAGAILTYLGSSIAYDAGRNSIAIWEKKSGARLVDPEGVGAWHSGTLLTIVLSRTTTTPMVQLFARADDEKPFFKVGVVDESDCEEWREILATAFGADMEREVAVSVVGT